MWLKTLAAALSIFCSISPALPSFTVRPSVTLAGDSCAIAFAVNEPIDVEVAAVGADGVVMRHLAAGVLGGEFDPPPPLRPGLSQSLAWDLKDDAGNALGGFYTIRVRLGVKPVFRQKVTTKVLVGTGFHYWSSMTSAPQEFMDPYHPMLGKIKAHACLATTMAACDLSDILFIKVQKDEGSSTLGLYDGRTGTFLKSYNVPFWLTSQSSGWGEPEPSWDGRYMYHDELRAAIISRFDYNGVRMPYPDKPSGEGSNEFVPPAYWSNYGADAQTKGHCGGPDGSHYALHMSSDRPDYMAYAVSSIKDGKLDRNEFIKIDGSVAGGIKVDAQGNVYVAAKVKVAGKRIPDDMVGKTSGDILETYSQTWWANDLIGSILKFTPQGGQVRINANWPASVTPDRTDVMCGIPDTPAGVQQTAGKAAGLAWMHFGVSPIANHVTWASSCWCVVSRFDVDRFGRVWFPNAIGLEFRAIDNNRNEMLRIKNVDVIRAGKIPVGVMAQIDVTDRCLYACDHFNDQIIIFDLKEEVKDSVNVEIAIENGRSRAREAGFALSSFPNPSNPSAAIEYRLASPAAVDLSLFDLSGRKVASLERGFMAAGAHRTIWNGRDGQGRPLAAGIYLCRLTAGGKAVERRIMLAR